MRHDDESLYCHFNLSQSVHDIQTSGIIFVKDLAIVIDTQSDAGLSYAHVFVGINIPAT